MSVLNFFKNNLIYKKILNKTIVKDWLDVVRDTFIREPAIVGKNTLEDMLKTIGLTDKETEIYIFLAKHGVQKISQISKSLKTNKGLAYRVLKNLQQKGLIR